jgi:hypothetical protein
MMIKSKKPMLAAPRRLQKLGCWFAACALNSRISAGIVEPLAPLARIRSIVIDGRSNRINLVWLCALVRKNTANLYATYHGLTSQVLTAIVIAFTSRAEKVAVKKLSFLPLEFIRV